MKAAKTATSASASPARKRSGKRRRVSAGDLSALKRELWFAIRRVSELLDDPFAEAGDVIKAANSLALVANSYRGITESAEFEAKLAALEAEVAQLKGQP